MKIKYFVSADIHGFYTPWRKALEQAGFNEEDSSHKIIICGDAFDRGEEALETYKFILKMIKEDRLIYVRGNHEDLMDDLLARKHPYSIDGHNGTYKTILQLAPNATDFISACDETRKLLFPLYQAMVDFYETKDYIFVHSTVPYGDNWRTESTKQDWQDARWDNPFATINYTDKIIVHGHWHNACYWRHKKGVSEYGEDAIHDICMHGGWYEHEGYGWIGLDTCTARSGKVNVFVVEEK